MKIGLIDADLIDNGTRHPNLALMKISGYNKSIGNTTELIYKDLKEIDSYDRVYISKVFNFTKIDSEILKKKNVIIGGTGFFEDGGIPLALEIEHHFPDYDLYTDFINEQIRSGKSRNYYKDYLDYSIGFTTRGCFRKCSFCVNKKYNKALVHSPLSEFLDLNRKYIYLWDDNIFAYEKWEDIFDELEKTNKMFQFRQGFDIRLLTEKKAERLAKSKYHGDVIFAFDNLDDKDIIVKSLRIWQKYNNGKTTKFYVFCAYNSQDEKDIADLFERIKILMEYGALPYVMRYERYKGSKLEALYTQIARWCNQPQFYKKKSFKEFCKANQDYSKNKEKNCCSYQSMLDFEKEFPEIAEKYFNLKFSEVYNPIPFGYGKKDNGELSVYERFVNNNLTDDEILKAYFSKDIDLNYLSIDQKSILVNKLGKLLLKTKINYLINLLKEENKTDIIYPFNIPQFSDFNDLFIITEIINRNFADGYSFAELGFQIGKTNNNILSLTKYGENHGKLTCLLDLTIIEKNEKGNKVKASNLLDFFMDQTTINKKKLVKILSFRIPIIKNIFLDAVEKEVAIEAYMKCLSQSTLIRRKSNVIKLIKNIFDSNNELEKIERNIKY